MKIVSIISLLFCLSLQAQQKRWQLDSIQQIQFYSDKKEYVYIPYKFLGISRD